MKNQLTTEQQEREKKLLADRIQIMGDFAVSYEYIERNPGISPEDKAIAKVLYARYSSLFMSYFDDVQRKVGIVPSTMQQVAINRFKDRFNGEIIDEIDPEIVKKDIDKAMSEIGAFNKGKNNKTASNNDKAIITFGLAASCTKVSDVSKSALALIRDDIGNLTTQLATSETLSKAQRVDLEKHLKDAQEREKIFRAYENNNNNVSQLAEEDAVVLEQALVTQMLRFKSLSTVANAAARDRLLAAGNELSIYNDIVGSYKFRGKAFEKAAEGLYGDKSAKFISEVAALGSIENTDEADNRMKQLIGFSSKDLGTTAADKRTNAEFDLNKAIDNKYPIYPDQLGNFYSAVFAAARIQQQKVAEKLDDWAKVLAKASLKPDKKGAAVPVPQTHFQAIRNSLAALPSASLERFIHEYNKDSQAIITMLPKSSDISKNKDKLKYLENMIKNPVMHRIVFDTLVHTEGKPKEINEAFVKKFNVIYDKLTTKLTPDQVDKFVKSAQQQAEKSAIPSVQNPVVEAAAAPKLNPAPAVQKNGPEERNALIKAVKSQYLKKHKPGLFSSLNAKEIEHIESLIVKSIIDDADYLGIRLSDLALMRPDTISRLVEFAVEDSTQRPKNIHDLFKAHVDDTHNFGIVNQIFNQAGTLSSIQPKDRVDFYKQAVAPILRRLETQLNGSEMQLSKEDREKLNLKRKEQDQETFARINQFMSLFSANNVPAKFLLSEEFKPQLEKHVKGDPLALDLATAIKKSGLHTKSPQDLLQFYTEAFDKLKKANLGAEDQRLAVKNFVEYAKKYAFDENGVKEKSGYDKVMHSAEVSKEQSYKKDVVNYMIKYPTMYKVLAESIKAQYPAADFHADKKKFNYYMKHCMEAFEETSKLSGKDPKDFNRELAASAGKQVALTKQLSDPAVLSLRDIKHYARGKGSMEMAVQAKVEMQTAMKSVSHMPEIAQPLKLQQVQQNGPEERNALIKAVKSEYLKQRGRGFFSPLKKTEVSLIESSIVKPIIDKADELGMRLSDLALLRPNIIPEIAKLAASNNDQDKAVIPVLLDRNADTTRNFGIVNQILNRNGAFSNIQPQDRLEFYKKAVEPILARLELDRRQLQKGQVQGDQETFARINQFMSLYSANNVTAKFLLSADFETQLSKHVKGGSLALDLANAIKTSGLHTKHPEDMLQFYNDAFDKLKAANLGAEDQGLAVKNFVEYSKEYAFDKNGVKEKSGYNKVMHSVEGSKGESYKKDVVNYMIKYPTMYKVLAESIKAQYPAADFHKDKDKFNHYMKHCMEAFEETSKLRGKDPEEFNRELALSSSKQAALTKQLSDPTVLSLKDIKHYAMKQGSTEKAAHQAKLKMQAQIDFISSPSKTPEQGAKLQKSHTALVKKQAEERTRSPLQH